MINLLSADELKILLALNGNQRLSYLEREIFNNVELTTVYMHHITLYRCDIGGLDWESTQRQSAYPNERAIMHYAFDILHVRWIAAEKVLKTKSIWASQYCNYFKIRYTDLAH